MNNACRPACNSGRKIILLDQQSSPARPGALPRHRRAIDASAKYHHVELLTIQRRALISWQYHSVFAVNRPVGLSASYDSQRDLFLTLFQIIRISSPSAGHVSSAAKPVKL
jgi:hypothetical protein